MRQIYWKITIFGFYDRDQKINIHTDCWCLVMLYSEVLGRFVGGLIISIYCFEDHFFIIKYWKIMFFVLHNENH